MKKQKCEATFTLCDWGKLYNCNVTIDLENALTKLFRFTVNIPEFCGHSDVAAHIKGPHENLCFVTRVVIKKML